jgi:RNA polymerase sigma-54 factor
MPSLALQPRLAQRQVATPAMMLEFSLLALPLSELRDAVKKEVDSNPALEVSREFNPGRVSQGTSEGFDFERVADDSGESLEDHLMSELRMDGVAGKDLEVCRAIIAELDEDGRFTGSYPDLVMTTGATTAQLEAARQRILAIDPKGCGARDLAECFRAQLDRIPAAKRPAVEKTLDELAAAIAKGDLQGFRPSDLATFRLLKTLEPFPGRLYDRRRVETVIPDVHVDEEGTVTVDQGDIPELRISPKYVELAKDRDADPEARAFAVEKVRQARAFREALLRRQNAMETIAEAAVGGQLAFLKEGATGLKRLTMSDVAKQAHVDVSTVSRAAARKYVKTPRGTFPLRKFFQLVDQGPIEKLREILEGLPSEPHVPDRVVVDLIAKAGYPMARRTVAKYRRKFGLSTPHVKPTPKKEVSVSHD